MTSTIQNQIFSSSDFLPYPIIFVHGIVSDFDPWTPAILKIGGALSRYEMRYQTPEKIFHNFDGLLSKPSLWNLSYYLDKPVRESFFGNLEEYALRLQGMVRLIQVMTGQPKVVLIAHSMGGLVARRYMTLNNETRNSVHKILTVGTPHEGVRVSPGVIPQFRDLQCGSDFLCRLDQAWQEKSSFDLKDVWGVVGAVSRISPLRGGLRTDAAGPGFVSISSSIPFGEWEEALKFMNVPSYLTAHFAYRVAVEAGHNELLDHPATYRAIKWACEK